MEQDAQLNNNVHQTPALHPPYMPISCSTHGIDETTTLSECLVAGEAGEVPDENRAVGVAGERRGGMMDREDAQKPIDGG